MKAGDALGLLAGLGALNALSGGRNGTGKRFTGLMDMLDGGGAGASGDRFEGGGLLSVLGNLFAKPLEAQQRVEEIATDTAATNAVTEVLKDAARKQFDSKTVQDLAAANENAYLQEAYGAPVGKTMDQAVGGMQYPSMYRSMDSRVGLLQQAQGSPNPRGNAPLRNAGAVQGMSGNFAYPKFSGNDASSQMDRYLPASMDMGQAPAMPQPNMPSPEVFDANPPSAAAMISATPAPADRNPSLQAFNEAMATVPQMLQGTEIAGMYRDHLLNGGGGSFAQFTGGQ